MTPVTNPTNEAEELYYRALVRTRVIVELTLGVVKNCFRCIHRFGGELQYTPLRSAKIEDDSESAKHRGRRAEEKQRRQLLQDLLSVSDTS
ncbi:hypothetical protein Pcinc_011751 [Petrolisthes cinctipes]|uniref:Uncharacterized protein n=1 Tax=Petrolisthes cinctipes TaxID=88211 RepID=A0AAE1G0Q0_PETCI|nr:hypothetical protein Pcinc_011751 [Petrolisthes cinctipes]